MAFEILLGITTVSYIYHYFNPEPSFNPEGSDWTPIGEDTEELRKGLNEHSEMLATRKKVNKEAEKVFQRGKDLNNQTQSTVVSVQQLNNDLKVEFIEENTRLIQENRDLKGKLSLEGQMEQNAKEAKESIQGIENAADKKIQNLNDQNSTLKLENNALQEKIIRLERQLKTKVRIL